MKSSTKYKSLLGNPRQYIGLIALFVVLIAGAWWLNDRVGNQGRNGSRNSIENLSDYSGKKDVEVTTNGAFFASHDCSESALTRFNLKEAGIALVLPCEYNLELPDPWAWGRHGSFVFYQLHTKEDKIALDPHGEIVRPHFLEIHFLNEDSVPAEEHDCYGPCVETVTHQEFETFKKGWTQNILPPQRERVVINERTYLAENEPWVSGFKREYSTFINNDTRMDVWIALESPAQASQADSLLKKLQFIEL